MTESFPKTKIQEGETSRNTKTLGSKIRRFNCGLCEEEEAGREVSEVSNQRLAEKRAGMNVSIILREVVQQLRCQSKGERKQVIPLVVS
jgi:hypothetical protein